MEGLRMMNARVMSPDEFLRLVGLQLGNYRPKEIVDLRAQIDIEISALALDAVMNGFVDREWAEAIVRMKLRLDGLYLDWAEGRIS
jgi:hypothetical protein